MFFFLNLNSYLGFFMCLSNLFGYLLISKHIFQK